MADQTFPPPVSNPRLLEAWTLVGRTLAMYQRIEYALKYLLQVIPQKIPIASIKPGEDPPKKVDEIKDTLGGLVRLLNEGGFLTQADDDSKAVTNESGISSKPGAEPFMSLSWTAAMNEDERRALLDLATLVLSERNTLVHHFHFKILGDRPPEEATVTLLSYYQHARDLHEKLKPLFFGVSEGIHSNLKAILDDLSHNPDRGK